MELQGRTVIVTGAGRGLGRAYATAFADHGANVVVNDLSERREDATGAQDTVDAIVAAGGRAVACAGSIADPRVAEAAVELARRELGPVDVVVNNAGNGGAHAIESTTAEEFRAFYEVHVLGSFNLAKAAWDDLAASGRGRIVNTVSGVGLLGLPHAVGYAAAKAGVLGLTRTLAVDGRAHGIAVNAIAPIALTEMGRPRFGDVPGLEPGHVAAAVLWLSDASCPLTGEIVSAGGGRVARWVIGVTDGTWLEESLPDAVGAEWAGIAGDEEILPLPDAMAEVELVLRGRVRA